ncbi:zinc-binding dehydrogenase [Streptomyces sp. Ru62]|uniref:zinc-binding dehydrogenase n=1 Tax=Streptomyces sp. Ru62 TaxID=2080745 RepID=UPI0011AFD367|nr:zinc-binding dehydrogenase [Streptomyces sp. Ru62]
MAVTMPTEPRGGAYSQYLTLPADAVVRAPSGVTPTEAATLPMNGLTARLALDLADVSAGQTLAVGAAGVVGGYVMQMARAEGLTVIADAAPSDEALVRALGADMVVLRGPGVAHRMLDVVPGGVDGLVDAAGPGSAAVAAAVADGGAIVALSGDGLRPLSPAELRRRSLRRYLAFIPDYLGDRGRLDHLLRQVEAGELTPRVARVGCRAGRRSPSSEGSRWRAGPDRPGVLSGPSTPTRSGFVGHGRRNSVRLKRRD